ncbi:four-helix bundle copper-binding protein [Streptomyces sp. NPDC051555]|uniref:four-helix bundle copper-binding protein n=1 Tax=Streptomyces sp. NPDC051555 TaxID=3365657 RepID=UPI0037943E94
MTTTVFAMMGAHPARADGSRTEKLAHCVEACLVCAQACTACADSCLAEGDAEELTACVTVALDCADVCAATARVLSRRTASDAALMRSLLQACTTACSCCADRCAAQAKEHRHCLICAEKCRDSQHACTEIFAVLV